MKIVTITEAKNGLSALLDRVRAGERVLIVDRGRPVARLEPAPSLDEDPDGRLARLQRAGLAEASDIAPPLEVARSRPPRSKKSALAALLDERRSGR